MQLLNILEEKYSLIISLLGPTVVLYIFPRERRRECWHWQGEGWGSSGFGLLAVNVTRCLVKAFSRSPVLILREKKN